MKILLIRLALLVSAGFGTHTAYAQRKVQPTPIEIDFRANDALKQLRSGAEASDFCEMADRGNPRRRLQGKSLRESVLVVSPGEELLWRLNIRGSKKKVEIVSFQFFEQVGNNFFLSKGGLYPERQKDGTWLGKVSEEAQNGHKLKYTMILKVDGQYFKVDPIVVVGGGGGNTGGGDGEIGGNNGGEDDFDGSGGGGD